MFIQAQQTQERHGSTRTYINTEQDTTSLRDDVQLSRVVPFTYISSNFIMFFYLTCSYRHSKLKKGMEVQEHIKKQLKLYKNTFCRLFHCKIQTFHCPNFKPIFPPRNFENRFCSDSKNVLTLPHFTKF